MNDEDDFVRITLRIPKKLHVDLTEAAAKKRSMNAEIIARLEASFGPAVEIDYTQGQMQELINLMNEFMNTAFGEQKERKSFLAALLKGKPEPPAD